MLKTTIGQLLVNNALPVEMRDYSRVINKKSAQKLFQELAEKHPDKYEKIAHKLFEVGQSAAYSTGGQSFGLKHVKTAQSAKAINNQIDRIVERIALDKGLSEEEKTSRIIEETGKRQQEISDAIMQESKNEGNPLWEQVDSGARGNPTNLKSLRGGDGLYEDQRDNLIPVPVTRSYSQGVTPAQFFGGAFGVRKSIFATKMSTADAGYLNKLLNQVSHRLVVTARDAEDPDELKDRGMPVATNDTDNEGALLAQKTGPYKQNTVLTPNILQHLKELGHARLLIRSPTVGGSPAGGVYGNDVGIRDKGRIAPLADNVGIAAASAVGEPISQTSLGSKHSGGIAKERIENSGFDFIERHVQIPKTFKGGAAHAQLDGKVEDITPAPAGGHYITIGGEKHFVSPGYELKVKRGDEVEAGDTISEGIPVPPEIVKHKGIGEGRRYFTHAFHKALKDSGITAHRRNIELVARGLINHVRLNDSYQHYVPDDVVQYSWLEHNWEPREGFKALELKRALNKYLEKPILHYSIGTKIRPSVIRELESFGIKRVLTHDDPPPFEPEMVRGMDNLSHDPDWMTKMLGSNLEKSLLKSTHRGAISDERGTSFVPGLARGIDFGRHGYVRDWHEAEKQFGRIGKVIP